MQLRIALSAMAATCFCFSFIKVHFVNSKEHIEPVISVVLSDTLATTISSLVTTCHISLQEASKKMMVSNRFLNQKNIKNGFVWL